MISLIIPLYNEAENVIYYDRDLFPVIAVIAQRTGERFHYIFVDDGSQDDTVIRLRTITKNRPDVKIVLHGVNRGMGNAIRTGLAASNDELVITMDSDLTFRPQDVLLLVEKFHETHADCVSGSPYLQRGLLEEVTPLRLFLSASVNFLYRLLLGKTITSVSPIFRLYKRAELEKLSISSNNFEINAEIIAKLIIAKKTVVEVPVSLLRRKHGSSKINVRKEIKNNIIVLCKIFRTKYLHAEWK
jgi:dolichol-phosphate mannosyltransferase